MFSSMELSRRTRLVLVVLQILVTWVPAIVYAGCAAACPFGGAASDHSCCPSAGAEPTLRMASCCEALEAATTEETSQAVVPASAFALAPAPPAELAGLPVAVAVAAPPPPSPPPLHEGIGLYTLHSAFLI